MRMIMRSYLLVLICQLIGPLTNLPFFTFSLFVGLNAPSVFNTRDPPTYLLISPIPFHRPRRIHTPNLNLTEVVPAPEPEPLLANSASLTPRSPDKHRRGESGIGESGLGRLVSQDLKSTLLPTRRDPRAFSQDLGDTFPFTFQPSSLPPPPPLLRAVQVCSTHKSAKPSPLVVYQRAPYSYNVVSAVLYGSSLRGARPTKRTGGRRRSDSYAAGLGGQRTCQTPLHTFRPRSDLPPRRS
ncbi:hypothetical protein BJ875DRAFT_2061 [Amylocarpus encephaloides]|uniref:Uncharacterized protein n=1 Tax=Amylocarpus encephaloides TaxID=45428 RepID=A0A9P7YU13_9HELO|nr:hypothetical protein BJ875DRAFT_2061 [Amylocarpus encephaloides]